MNQQQPKIICAHCGDDCPDDTIKIDDKYFCCNGCKTVYQLLNDDELKKLYEEINFSKNNQTKFNKGEFEFLNDERILNNLLDYQIEDKSKVTLYLPQIYCSACLYLIENLAKLNQWIYESQVDFLRKEVSIVFNNKKTNLKEIVELLTAIGYRPQLNIADIERPKEKADNKNLYIKLGIAGFCFGNVMLMSLPEYFSGGNLEPVIKKFFDSINIFFAILTLYAATDYFKSAINSLRIKFISIDVPIALGILVLFLRSAWDIFMGIGPGYVDTLSGLVFFMLTGKIFQQKTYYNLSFDRNYKSYFPLSVIKIEANEEKFVPIIDVGVGDRLKIRSSEIIPADSILISGNAEIDYSFVTGESRPVNIKPGDRIYAGGKQTRGTITIETVKNFNQSYLTELWNKSNFKKEKFNNFENITNKVSGIFTIIILIIAITGFLYWLPTSIDKAFHAFTSVLIIACPCALALTVPFTLGTAIRIYSRNNMFLKNTLVIEKMTEINSIIFDKTGTLTYHDKNEVKFVGDNLTDEELILIKSTVANSTHPLSRIIYKNIEKIPYKIENYNEIAGLGIEAEINGKRIKIGSKKWILNYENAPKIKQIFQIMNESTVFVSIDDQYKGYFVISSKFRDGLKELIDSLKKEYKIYVISGDNNSDEERLKEIVGNDVEIKFEQLPDDKIKFVKDKSANNEKIMMLGDGLNDIGALQTADIGIAITEDTANFSPKSDGILLSTNLNKLKKFLDLSKYSRKTIILSFIISFLYNVIGLSFALTGELSPVVAAILMPISSVSVIALTVLRVNYFSLKNDLYKKLISNDTKI